MNVSIRPRDRDAVIQSLRAGVVPRSGQHLIHRGYHLFKTCVKIKHLPGSHFFYQFKIGGSDGDM